jgi:hypothetical protein
MSADNPFAASLAEPAAPEPVPFPVFHRTARWKVLVYSVATGGLYEMLWFWRNFRRRPGLGDAIGAGLATGFRIFTTHGLFREISRARERADAPDGGFRPGPLATLYVLTVLGGTIAQAATETRNDLMGLVVVPVLGTALRAVPIAAAQDEINRHLAVAEPERSGNDRIDVWSAVALLVGALVWGLATWATWVPV